MKCPSYFCVLVVEMPEARVKLLAHDMQVGSTDKLVAV
jgi:hypothetical protein